MIIRYGATRTVILFRSLAIKFPKVSRGWKKFFQGLVCNLSERDWWRWTRDQRLCPVYFTAPLGLFVIMPRVTMMTEEECDELDIVADWDGLPMDDSHTNFGWLEGQAVLIDYGS